MDELKNNEIPITSVEEYIRAIKDNCLKCKPSNMPLVWDQQLSDVWFRGEPEYYDDVLPSLFRGKYNGSISPIADENVLIKKAIQYNPTMFDNCHSQLERLVKMQHYGLPTRLLDVTKSPFVALYMACEKEQGTKDGRVLFVDNLKTDGADDNILEYLVNLIGVKTDRDENNRHIYKISFGDAIKYLKNNTQLYLPLERRLEIFQKATKSLIFLPKYNNDRIKLQQGAMIFSALYSPIDTHAEEYDRLKSVRARVPLAKQKITEKELNKIVFCNVPKCLNDLFSSTTFLIDKGIKQEIITELNNYGVNEATVYPEPEHQMRYVARCNIDKLVEPIK